MRNKPGSCTCPHQPKESVVAIDLSQPSIDHHRFLKEKHDLANLELRLLPIEEAGKFERESDLIVTTGVLHHLASPVEGMKTLSRCLRIDDVLCTMLYAKLVRIGVELLPSAFGEKGLIPSGASVAMVKEAMRETGGNCHGRSVFAPA